MSYRSCLNLFCWDSLVWHWFCAATLVLSTVGLLWTETVSVGLATLALVLLGFPGSHGLVDSHCMGDIWLVIGAACSYVFLLVFALEKACNFSSHRKQWRIVLAPCFRPTELMPLNQNLRVLQFPCNLVLSALKTASPPSPQDSPLGIMEPNSIKISPQKTSSKYKSSIWNLNNWVYCYLQAP